MEHIRPKTVEDLVKIRRGRWISLSIKVAQIDLRRDAEPVNRQSVMKIGSALPGRSRDRNLIAPVLLHAGQRRYVNLGTPDGIRVIAVRYVQNFHGAPLPKTVFIPLRAGIDEGCRFQAVFRGRIADFDTQALQTALTRSYVFRPMRVAANLRRTPREKKDAGSRLRPRQ